MLSIGQIDASLRTDQGRVRDHNEDFIAFHEPTGLAEEKKNGWLYIVADGVGGALAGEVASRYATERTIHHYLSKDTEKDWGERLRESMKEANTELRQLALENSVGNRMATTMVATVIHDGLATIANVGDSRGYHWQNGQLRQVTKDHSLVARLVEEGAITEEEAATHPRRNVILHSLGSESAPQIDLYTVPLLPREQLILCSDGLVRHVADEEIAAIVAQHNPAEATELLINLANNRGGEDNISVAVLQIGDQPSQTTVIAGPDLEPILEDDALLEGERDRRALLTYTIVLCLVQIVLIFLIWISVQG